MRKPRLKPSDTPLAFNLFGATIPVVQHSPKPEENGAICLGEYSEQRQTILINIHHPRTTLHDTLVHEALHAVFHLSGISAMTDAHDNLEETIVRAITTAFAPAIDLSKLTVATPPQEIPHPPEGIK